MWNLPPAGLVAVKAYLETVRKGCDDGSIRYQILHFNCLHFAFACLRAAGVMTCDAHAKRDMLLTTVAPGLFVNRLMPEARTSVMYHDLMPFCLRDGV